MFLVEVEARDMNRLGAEYLTMRLNNECVERIIEWKESRESRDRWTMVTMYSGAQYVIKATIQEVSAAFGLNVFRFGDRVKFAGASFRTTGQID